MIKVAVGCLIHQGKVLLCQRLAHQSYAGEWEFPGGKLEAMETPEQALMREFSEETGLLTSNWQSLITYPWDHGDQQVQLYVFVSESFSGELKAHEGHQFKWCPFNELDDCQMLQANRGMVRALQLPSRYMISGGFHDHQDAITRLKAALLDGVKLVQLRAKTLEKDEFVALAQAALPLCHGHGAKLILNARPEWLDLVPQADGLQLASSALMHFNQRPIPSDKLLGVSTHNEIEIAKALELGADFILISPVKPTSSHPDTPALGWAQFASLSRDIPVPVYALGGLAEQDLADAISHGAQGIAAISGLWPQPL